MLARRTQLGTLLPHLNHLHYLVSFHTTLLSYYLALNMPISHFGSTPHLHAPYNMPDHIYPTEHCSMPYHLHSRGYRTTTPSNELDARFSSWLYVSLMLPHICFWTPRSDITPSKSLTFSLSMCHIHVGLLEYNTHFFSHHGKWSRSDPDEKRWDWSIMLHVYGGYLPPTPLVIPQMLPEQWLYQRL